MCYFLIDLRLRTDYYYLTRGEYNSDELDCISPSYILLISYSTAIRSRVPEISHNSCNSATDIIYKKPFTDISRYNYTMKTIMVSLKSNNISSLWIWIHKNLASLTVNKVGATTPQWQLFDIVGYFIYLNT